MAFRINNTEKEVLERLLSISSEITALRNMEALLHWDQEVYMPPGGAEDRANQLAVLNRIIHQKETLPEIDEILDLILKINHNGTTIILIEHIMKAIMNISNRVVVLNYGVKIAEGTPEEIASDDTVIKAYLGEEYVLS